jgi:hypothetical protein
VPCRDLLGFVLCHWFTAYTVDNWEHFLLGVIVCYRGF